MPTDERTPSGEVTDIDHPWIVIPYYEGDQGGINGPERPLKAKDPSGKPIIDWLCPSIIVRGVNYTSTPGTYQLGEPLSISVDVSNFGVPSAVVTVTVFWADPSLGFANRTQILSASFPVAGRSISGPTRSPEMIWTPEQVPSHFCLLVEATTFPPESVSVPANPDPVGDRHWAQYNLQAVTVSTSKKLTFLAWATNPGVEFEVFNITLRPVSEEGLIVLARLVKAEQVAIKKEQVVLSRAKVEADERGSRPHSVVLKLEPGSREPLIVSAQAPDLSPHQFAAIELVQTRVGDERKEGSVTGSLGIVMFGGGEVSSPRR